MPCGWQKTDRSGDKSQLREATAERFACSKEGRTASNHIQYQGAIKLVILTVITHSTDYYLQHSLGHPKT